MATTVERRPAPIERTEHPHIVKSQGTLGGKARVDGTRISVLLIFQLMEAGTRPEEIAETYSPLTLAQVHDAISYAYDHPQEMADDASRQTLRSVLKRADMVYVDGRLIPRSALEDSKIPPGARVYTWETLPKEYDR